MSISKEVANEHINMMVRLNIMYEEEGDKVGMTAKFLQSCKNVVRHVFATDPKLLKIRKSFPELNDDGLGEKVLDMAMMVTIVEYAGGTCKRETLEIMFSVLDQYRHLIPS